MSEREPAASIPAEATQTVLRLEGVRKSYNVGQANEIEVLHGIDLKLDRGDFAALIGPSGSGKSTLLNLIGLLDTPTSGELSLLGQRTRSMDDARRTALRSRAIGFVFQFHLLIQAFSALDNVLMPLMLAQGKPGRADIERARTLLGEVGLGALINKHPNQLSGGEQQRVAICRALYARPALLLADEPTGNLDTQSAAAVFALLRRFSQTYGCAVLLVTHDPRLSDACDHAFTLVDGQLVGDASSILRKAGNASAQ